jgi:Winged helix DNA-binding domain
MRGTIHIVSAADFWLLAAGIRRAYRQWWERLHADEAKRADSAIAAVEQALRGRTCTLDELNDLYRKEGLSRAVPGPELVRVPPAGTWAKRRAHTFALAEDWLGPCTASEDEGREHLVRRYLGGFGPATRNEIANWSGVPVTALAPTLDRMSLRRFRNEDGKELLDLPRAPLPGPETPAPVRFLPTWDAALLAHARSAEVLPERYRPRIFHTRAPQSFQVFLVDGAVAGTWKLEDGRIRIEPFERLSPAARQEVEAEAARLTAFHE